VIADGNLYYTDIQTSFDTSRVINDITLSNDGVRPTAFGSAAREPYTVTWRETDTGSVTDWGARSYQLNTNLRTEALNYNWLPNPSLAYGNEGLASGASDLQATREQLSVSTTGATGLLPVGTTQPVAGVGDFIARARITANQGGCPIVYGGPTSTGNYAAFTVQPNTQYTASAYMRAGVGHNASLTGIVAIRWYNDIGGTVSTVSGAAITMNSTAWQRRTLTATAPATARYAVMFAQFNYTGANNTGFRYYATAAQFENAASASTWFSGDVTDTATNLFEWEGQPGNSRSVIYDNTIDTRALELLADFADPEVTVNSITFNTAQNPIISVGIDIASLVNIEFNGTTTLYRVTGISHDITPERWMMTLQTAKVI
jgi:hypothetical protein